MQSLADVLAPALVGRDDPPPDPAVLGSTVFSIAGLCAAHACLDDQALLAAREAIGQLADAGLGLRGAARLRRLRGVAAVQRRARLRREGVRATRTPTFARSWLMAAWGRDRSDALDARAAALLQMFEKRAAPPSPAPTKLVGSAAHVPIHHHLKAEDILEPMRVVEGAPATSCAIIFVAERTAEAIR